MKPAEKYRAWKAHRPEKPIFRTILFSMMAVLLAEVILLSTGIGLTNVSGRLNQNAKQIVNMQVRNRASYLQDMLIKAQELTDISTTINNLTQQMLQDGTISLDTMDQSSEAADPLMEAAAPYLVSALRARPVTGIFLVINTHDLAEKEVGSPMPSVYLRDLDPDARPSDRNTDLMLERSSAAVVKALGITTDKSWSTALNCRGLARPAEQLYCEVLAANGKQTFPKFSHTGIRELDRFAEAITQLNSSLVTNSTKFLRIMDMASVELGGYELRYDTGSVYVTKNFFALLGAPEVDGSSLTVRTFGELLEHIQLTRPCTVNAEGDKVLTVVQGGCTRYIMLRVTTEDWVQVGLAEDVTAATQERLRIERERDYDVLTGLYNRQAFHRVSHELFQNPERLGVAALLMMDLDDLKHINDTYGHDWGDHYIQNTGRCIAEHSPPGTVCARLSGDEFLLLFYGYPGREQLREKLEALTRAMQQAVVVLPSGSDLHISISGGVAWYPEDGRDIETLKKYADFAMYQVKHSTKGQMKDFDIGVYNQEAYIARTRREFHQLISEERMYYYFQPIFSAQTGRVHAYEALMRSDLPTLRSPATIMKLAREQGALYEIERLTFRKALEGFDNLRSKNLVDRQALIFINSIASVCLRREDSEYMDQRWHELRRQMVIEITEEEEMNRQALESKRHAPGFSGMFALDDYGSGYSNEGSLLELAPRFIKVDISIIRGIDSDPDKQQILRNVVRYAQPRSMQIIAEGVETAAEMRTVIDLGADLLQGYFLARPAAVPDPIAPEAAEIIRAI